MSSIEDLVLESIKRQPEHNPDGSVWKFKMGGKSWTKQYIIANWKTNTEMRKFLVDIYMDQVSHMAGRDPT